MNDLLELMVKMCAGGAPFAHVAVLSQDGSTPRTAGARMLVMAGGGIRGTIGGGRVEAEAMRLAETCLDAGEACTVSFDLLAKEGDTLDLDMICGGRIEVLVEPFACPAQAPVLTALSRLRSERRPCSLVTSLIYDGAKGLRVERCLLDEGGRTVAVSDPAALDEARARQALSQAGNSAWRVVEAGDMRCLVERFEPPHTVYIFGGGHVGKATAELAAYVGFRVAVLDDRPEFANPGRFPMADLVAAPPSLEGIFGREEMAEEPMGDRAYLVIVTRGHRHDALVLGQALETGAGYIGMIGSSSKRKATYEALAKEGFGPGDFGRVHSPIGLSIGAQTPEEIAVSIVGELIQARSKGAKK